MTARGAELLDQGLPFKKLPRALAREFRVPRWYALRPAHQALYEHERRQVRREREAAGKTQETSA